MHAFNRHMAMRDRLVKVPKHSIFLKNKKYEKDSPYPLKYLKMISATIQQKISLAIDIS